MQPPAIPEHQQRHCTIAPRRPQADGETPRTQMEAEATRYDASRVVQVRAVMCDVVVHCGVVSRDPSVVESKSLVGLRNALHRV